jgi:hypothetical protein
MATETYTDAIALLKADHRKVEALFEQFEKATTASRKQSLAHEICTELKIHMMLEEEIFYPAFEGKIDQADIAEAFVEHDSAKVLINDIESATPKGDDYYDAKVHVMSEEVEHHVKEEEEPGKGVFAQCRKTDVDLVALRDALLDRKEELMKLAKGKGLPAIKPIAINLVEA